MTHKDIPATFPVAVLNDGDEAKDRATCGNCGLSWDDAISTSYTPAPSGRCPFEYFHAEVKQMTQEQIDKTVQTIQFVLADLQDATPEDLKTIAERIWIQDTGPDQARQIPESHLAALPNLLVIVAKAYGLDGLPEQAIGEMLYELGVDVEDSESATEIHQCHFCQKDVDGWNGIPSFFRGEDEIVEPVCNECASTKLTRDADTLTYSMPAEPVPQFDCSTD